MHGGDCQLTPSGVDLSLQGKQYSKPNLGLFEAKNVTLSDNKCDLVFASNILQWLKDKFTVLLFCIAELFTNGYLGLILIIGMGLCRKVLLFEK